MRQRLDWATGWRNRSTELIGLQPLCSITAPPSRCYYFKNCVCVCQSAERAVWLSKSVWWWKCRWWVWTSLLTELELSRGSGAAGEHTTGQSGVWGRDLTFTLVKPHHDVIKEVVNGLPLSRAFTSSVTVASHPPVHTPEGGGWDLNRQPFCWMNCIGVQLLQFKMFFSPQNAKKPQHYLLKTR